MSKHSSRLAIQQPAPCPAVPAELADEALWMGSAGLAKLAEIDESNASKALLRGMNGKAWRGNVLTVRSIDMGKGRGGKSLQVYVPSLPADLRDTWHTIKKSAPAEPVSAPIQRPMPTHFDLSIGTRVAEMRWKLAIVAPALAQPKRSEARAAMLREIAAREHKGFHGKPVQIAVDTLRDWLSKIETNNEQQLARRHRADIGKPRYFVNAEWDKACPLQEFERRQISADIALYIRGLHKGLCPARKINSLASAELQRLSREAGWLDAGLIKPGLFLVRKLKSSRLPGIREFDAKLFHDTYRPSIHRCRPDWPMEIVYGDVHPDDILVRRKDGTTATSRMIAWLDLCTNDFFYTLILLPEGKSVTQAHIIASFIEMVQAWGLPKNLYLDNGSEYLNGPFLAGLEKLQGLCAGFRAHVAGHVEINDISGYENDENEEVGTSRTGVIRAKPYNARAKGIEGAFSGWNKFVSMIPGYIGGDRMRKKTQNVGKVPQPFPGTFEQLRDKNYAEAMAFYRNEPQSGTMGGKSPNQKKREAIAAGWTPPASVDPATLLVAFAEVGTTRVQTGGVKIVNKWYWHDDLVPVMGEKITYHYASWKDQIALWVKPDGQPVILARDIEFHPLDTAGAKEQSRREGIQKRNVAAIRRLSPPVDTNTAMAQYNAAMPLPPVTPAGPQILLSQETKALADAVREASETPAPPPEKLPHLAYRDKKTGAVVLPAQPVAVAETKCYDIYATPPPQKAKPDASADAPGFDLYAAYAKTPPLNDQEKETETT